MTRSGELEGDAQFGERAQDEVTVLCPRMRKRQRGVVADDAIEVDEVDVDGSRSVPDGSDAAEPVFDGMHPSGKIVWLERRVKYEDLVEELHRRVFGRYVDRLRFDDRACLQQMRAGERRQGVSGLLEVVGARLDV